MKRGVKHYKRRVRNILSALELLPYIHNRMYSFRSFDFTAFKKDIFSFLRSMQVNNIYEYRFSASQRNGDLYSSIYALMIYGLFNEIDKISSKQKRLWAEYILSCQAKDGLFRDKFLRTTLAETTHHWGWHHLVPHVLIGLDYLNVKPSYDFAKILKIFDDTSMGNWLEARNWKACDTIAVDNEIMNIGIMLQYSRDYFHNQTAKSLIEELEKWLLFNKRDPRTSLWYPAASESIFNLHKALNFSYHIITLYYYDGAMNGFDADRILKYALQNQNLLNSFGTSVCSDACSDIDCLYLLAVIPAQNSYLQQKIRRAIVSFMNWVFTNMNKDGGFVFRRCSPFQYGDQPLLSSKINESNMFATWFRVLSIAYACKYLSVPNDFKFSKVPGYQFVEDE